MLFSKYLEKKAFSCKTQLQLPPLKLNFTTVSMIKGNFYVIKYAR